MSRPTCANERCTRPAMRREVVKDKLGARGVSGLCPLHTVRGGHGRGADPRRCARLPQSRAVS